MPQEFHYLIGPAEKFGPLWLGGGGYRRRLKQRDLEELAPIADRVAWSNHWFDANSWAMDRFTRNPMPMEGRLLTNLLCILGDQDFELEDAGPRQEPDFTIQRWETGHYGILHWILEPLRHVLSDDEAFEVVSRALLRTPDEERPWQALFLAGPLRSRRALDWLEDNPPRMLDEDSPELARISWPCWGCLAALSHLDWSRVVIWLDRGPPLSRVAIDALANLGTVSKWPTVQEIAPRLVDPPTEEIAQYTLMDYLRNDRKPEIGETARQILSRWSSIIEN